MISKSEIKSNYAHFAILVKQFFKINIHLLFKVVLLLRLNTKIIICFPFNEIMHFTHSYESAFVVTKQNTKKRVAGAPSASRVLSPNDSPLKLRGKHQATS